MELFGSSGRHLHVGTGHTRVMGVVNVTPDSFSDGGRFLDPEAAIAQGLRMVREGADVLDVGGESTRPGYVPVAPAQQLERILPVIAGLRQQVDVPISVDTTRAVVAAAALDAGADWVNDTTALQEDPEMAELCADRGCTVVLMHRFVPSRKQTSGPPSGREMVALLVSNLAARLQEATSRGIREGTTWSCWLGSECCSTSRGHSWQAPPASPSSASSPANHRRNGWLPPRPR
ncbi:MAG: dihydropteroate synthase [Planctomycetota bacterium]